MNILITGSSGYIGSRLTTTLSDHTIIGLDTHPSDKPDQFYQEDLRNTSKDQLQDLITKHNIDTIIHLAAEKNLKTCEEKPKQAKTINYHSTLKLLEAAKTNTCHLIYISSDQIFDGEKQQPYTIPDTPRPINIYGVTKTLSEAALQTYSKATIIRTAMVYDTTHSLPRNRYLESEKLLIQGEIIPHLHIRDQANKETYLPRNEVINPTSVPTLNNQIQEILENNIYGIQHCCGSTAVNKYQFGQQIADIYNLKQNHIKPITTDNPIRPENVSLATETSENQLDMSFPTLKEQLQSLHEHRN